MSEPAVPGPQRFPEPRGERAVAAKLTVRASRRYRAAAQRVFDAWLEPELAVRWLFATATRPLARAEIDARVGGRFRLVDAGGPTVNEWTGQYLVVEPPRRLVFTLSVEHESATTVAVEIAGADRGCRLTLQHEGVPRSVAKRFRQRWIGVLYGLDVTLRATASATSARFAGASLRARGFAVGTSHEREIFRFGGRRSPDHEADARRPETLWRDPKMVV
jgi:uncharacterized protein YndB with AHSA1/START domain